MCYPIAELAYPIRIQTKEGKAEIETHSVNIKPKIINYLI